MLMYDKIIGYYEQIKCKIGKFAADNYNLTIIL